jgi:hypothetical protein
VAYRVTLDDSAQAQVRALSRFAGERLAEAMTVLELVPWNGSSLNPLNPDGSVRALAFGSFGLITYLVLEDQERVDVLQVVWVGPAESERPS